MVGQKSAFSTKNFVTQFVDYKYFSIFQWLKG